MGGEVIWINKAKDSPKTQKKKKSLENKLRNIAAAVSSSVRS
jgi:hypothetical protein